MIDPHADPGRRAWINCAACDDHSGWCYLLGYEVGNLFCQCPACGLRFWWDSGFGTGGAPQRPALWWPLAS
jgi:hypothetical protein